MEIINILYRLYSPQRCLTCFDALALFADISIGDPWLPPPDDNVDFYKGWSFALVRNPEAGKICHDLVANGALTIQDLTRKEALSCNTMMSNEKIWRAFRIIETRKRQGRAVPKYTDYELSLPQHGLKQFLKTEINMFTHILCFMPKLRAPVLKFFLGNGGYTFLLINNWRRRLRYFIRDGLAWCRRKIFGRK
jgi:Coenzyme F420 hydrogenase/dehydrogenase, beta subunit C terminus